MALVSVASAKGSPGVTTSSLVVAALWPRPVLLADCDPAGGDVAVRMPGHDGGRLDPDRGLVSLAAGGRHGLRPEQVHEHAQTLAGGLDVLVGVSTPEQAQAMSPIWNDLGRCLDAVGGRDVVADVGRLGPTSAGVASTLPVLLASRLVVLVCRPDLSSVVHLRERLGMLTHLLRPRAMDGVPLCVVVVAPPNERRAVEGVQEVITREHPDVAVAGQLAYDPKAATFFNGEPSGRIDRSPLVRSGRMLAGRLAGAVAPFWSDASSRVLPPAPYPQPRRHPGTGGPVGRPQVATGPQRAGLPSAGPPGGGPPGGYRPPLPVPVHKPAVNGHPNHGGGTYRGATGQAAGSHATGSHATGSHATGAHATPLPAPRPPAGRPPSGPPHSGPPHSGLLPPGPPPPGPLPPGPPPRTGPPPAGPPPSVFVAPWRLAADPSGQPGQGPTAAPYPGDES